MPWFKLMFFKTKKKEVIVPSKFVKIMGIFDKIDNLENQGVI